MLSPQTEHLNLLSILAPGARLSTNEKLQYFSVFHGKLPISWNAVHFAFRVTAVKLHNIIGRL